MYALEQVFTSGNWLAREGREKEFQKAWQDFANWAAREKHGSESPYLLQDLENPRHFISFGPWPDVEAIKKWRETEEFRNFVIRVKELCEKFEPFTLRVVARGE